MKKPPVTYDFRLVKDDATRRIEIIPVVAAGPNAIESRLEAMTAGSIARLVRLASGREQVPDLWAVRDTSSRIGSFWHELYLWFQVPVDEVRKFVIETLRDARRQQRRRRKTRPRMLAALPLRFAVTEVASVIMRHGPPLALAVPDPRPGPSERQPMKP